MTEIPDKGGVERGNLLAYEKLQGFVKQIGGEITWHPMGRGGDWHLNLHGKTAIVGCRDRTVNRLDHCYVPKVLSPKTWDDYDKDAPLAPDAFWKLVDIVHPESAAG
jgi:hypothetical protein